MLGWKAIFTLVVVALMFFVLALNKFNDTLVIFLAYTLFANSGLITVGALFIVVHTMGRTQVVSTICHKAFGNSPNPMWGMTRFLVIVNCLSAVFNNTPLVALMMPIVRDWARSRSFPRSKFLIPLSFAAITGGMLTTIGTSTTLLVQGYLTQAKVQPFSFFEVGYIGLPAAGVAIIYLMTFGFWVLPDTGSGMLGQAQKGSEDFVTELAIGDGFKGIGSSIYTSPFNCTLTLKQVLDKLKIHRSSLLEVWRVIPRDQNLEAAALSQLQDAVVEVSISDTADVGSGGPALRHTSSSRLNLPVSPELSTRASPLQVSAIATPPPSSNAVQRRQVASEESSNESVASVQPHPQAQLDHAIELAEIPSANDASETQSLLSPHLTRDYTKLESTQINEGNILRSGDRLILSAKLENLQHLRHMNLKGVSIGDSVINGFHDVDSEFVELVVSHRCPHIGKAINSREIRQAYNFGGIVGARRHGISLPEILTDTKLATGDTLLVVASVSNLNSYQNSKDFYVACSVGSIPRAITWWDYMPIVNFLIMISLPAADVIPMEQSAILFASVCFVCGWITPAQALEVIDFSLLIMIAASIGISRSMELSGVSKALGDWLKDSNFSPWSANCLLYFIALALTEIVTNNAAAAICIPIALSAARAMDVSFKPFAMSVIMAASSGFAIPFGYACHLMVMGPGGYTLAHFVKIGLPLDIIIWLLCSWLIPIIWPF